MKIAGDKVILRAVEEQDSDMLYNLIKNSETSKGVGGYHAPNSCSHQMDWFRSSPDGSLRFIIAGKECPENALGIIFLSSGDFKRGEAELYIKLMKSARGKGYGKEAVAVLVSYGFRELRLHHIYSNILECNLASLRLFEKCGFQKEAVHRSKVYKDGHYENVCVYGISSGC